MISIRDVHILRLGPPVSHHAKRLIFAQNLLGPSRLADPPIPRSMTFYVNSTENMLHHFGYEIKLYWQITQK